MKIVLIIVIYIMMATIGYSQSNCDSYYSIVEGASWTHENFDKKGKSTSTNTTIVKSVVSINETKTEFKLELSSKDTKSKADTANYVQEIVYVCENGNINVEMSSFITPEMQQSYASLDVEIEQSELIVPKELNKGQQLNDAYLKIIVSGGYILVTVNVTDRKVEDMVEITTEAGTFNCALITSVLNMKMAFMKQNRTIKEWISPEVGVVKTENYDKKGKLISSSVLKEYSK